MVVTQECKPKPKKVARRVSVGIRQNIPFKKTEVVTRTIVSRKLKNRVVTKSTKVVVPIAPSFPSGPSDSSHLPPSNQDTPPTPSKQARKGPSRSAAVNLPPLPFLLTN